MGLDDINLDFDINKFFAGIRDAFFKTVKLIFMMIFGLPNWIKITIAIIFVSLVIGIAWLIWKYRHEWHHVTY